MKRFLCVAFLIANASLFAAQDEFDPKSPRRIQIGETPLVTLALGGKPLFDIVHGGTPSAKFAATELADVLALALEARPKVIAEPSGDRPCIMVGVRQAEGIDRDGFIIRTEDNRLHIYGKDDPTRRLIKDSFGYRESPDRGTLNGVYDFLERFAGVHFFFPGEMGTIVPRLQDWSIPTIDIMDRPDFTYRHLKMPDEWSAEEAKRASFRLRSSSTTIPNCHGLAFLGLIQRFKESHPEYFALMDNGLRHYDTNAARRSSRMGHICLSSGVREVIAEDAIAFLSGHPAAERGVCPPNGKIGWSHSRFPAGMPYFNIMPNDSYYRCRCENCWPHYSQGAQETSNFTWAFFNEIARKVKASGVHGRLTTMAYDGYRLVPDMPIEDNILVMLALRGPWNEQNPTAQKWGLELLQAWNKKINRKLWLWTYPSKFHLDMPGLPNVAPRAFYTFYKSCQPWIFGAYLEAETDSAAFTYLNFYVFSRLAWDNSISLDSILSDYYQTMFGPAGDTLRLFDENLEANWMKVVTPFVDTDEGPVAHPPATSVIWNEIYTPDFLAEQGSLLDKAADILKNHPDEAKRLLFYRQQYHEPILVQREAWLAENRTRDHWVAYPPCKLTLIPKGGKAEVRTTVSITEEENDWHFSFDAEEPFVEKIPLVNRPHDDRNVWADGCLTIFLDPACSRQDYFQIEFSPSGSLTDLRHFGGKSDYGWESQAKVTCTIQPGKGWLADIRIPKAAIGTVLPDGMGMNFMRYRVIPGVSVQTTTYQWNPSGKSPHAPVNWGRLLPGATEPPSLILNGDFDGEPRPGSRSLGKERAWFNASEFRLDKEEFITNGQCLVMLPNDKVAQYMPALKPNAKYRLSFYAKVADVEGTGLYVKLDEGSGYVTTWPKVPLKGGSPWRRYETILSTNDNIGRDSRPYLRFQFPATNGKAWVDHVRMVELP
ncbi:MAG: DUF4838 domain-containing protein [Victivallales bacterium]|nr:DUF4838 domain-containing protein [Victivallales bacterium]